MTVFLPRLLYLLAALAWYMLLWPNQVTIFMAACFSCLTLPYYRNLRRKTSAWRIRLERNRPDTLQRRLLLKLSRHAALYAYITTLLSAFFVPIAMLALLVSPQAAAGLVRLRELQANNFQIPPDWVEYIQQWRMSLAEYPRVEKVVNDFFHNLDTLFADTMSLLLTRGFDVLGGTMTAFWTTFLFLTLTVVFTVYARRIRKIAGRIFHLPQSLLSRFICAIHKALRAILLGIVLVALAQGVLCGIGFAVAGINQPAFWGMLATLVAPIPVVGTALIWMPLCLSLWFTGKAMAAVGLGLWGVIAVAGVDNVLRPLFLRQGIKAPFFVLILAILCGLASFGPVGLIAGPVLLAFAIQAVEEANRFYQAHEPR
ncbi:AI-2E family transporter [Desulfovibrio sp. ZJ200]|uniref:AI-2E family transporter n=1 Tax=Desulfovibrio sp. ZJ200 TaxID=2709792 RepID=UPI0013EBD24B|nr:AI-2E family transporter [Desulfovibrio sp. ZJ200]